ncbi:hypothetical protein, partial [Klebsiella pneumoniae]
QNDVTLKMPAFEWVHVQLHQQKGMISLSPPTICNSAVETHDRIVGKTWREAKRQHDETISGSKATLTDTIRTF